FVILPPSALYTLSLHDALPICLRACDMNKTKTAVLTVASLASILAGLIVFAFYDLSHKPLLSFTSEELADVQIAFKGALGEAIRSEEHTSELQSLAYLVCRLLL